MVLLENAEENAAGQPDLRPAAADFAMLGVRPQEARLPVIRRAARRTAAPLVAASIERGEPAAEESLASTLAAAYRLIDPRRRSLVAEKVGLLQFEPSVVQVPVWWNQPSTPADGPSPTLAAADASGPSQHAVEAPPIVIDSGVAEVHRLAVRWVREAEQRSRRQKYFTCFGVGLILSTAGLTGWWLGGDSGVAVPAATSVRSQEADADPLHSPAAVREEREEIDAAVAPRVRAAAAIRADSSARVQKR